MKRLSIFLIISALIAVMAGCGPVRYSLTIDGTLGGAVTVDDQPITEKTTLAYNPGTVISVAATPNSDYRFVRWMGDTGSVASTAAAITTITMDGDHNITAYFEPEFMVAAGGFHTVGLKSDGTVVAVGFNTYAQCDVGNWTDIVQVAAGWGHTVGLRSDGTVVAVGHNGFGQCNVDGWTDIIQVTAKVWHTVGLRSDGTVVAVGDNNDGQCNVAGWTDIVQVAAGSLHTLGLKCDGTVVAVGDDSFGQCEVTSWYLN
jgi:alpha-tubulin suppressor-like RCC1 family protein